MESYIGNALTSRAMLVKFSRTTYAARKYDKKVTAEVEQSHGTKGDAGRYNKILIAKEALEAGQKAANDARTFLYSQTLPWNDEGYRILTAANYLPFTQSMRRKIISIEAADRDFIARYPEFKEEAKARLNGMFEELDYPPVDEIEKKFSVSIQFSPIPDSKWTTVIEELTLDQLNEMQKSSDLRVNEAIAEANKDLWKRLHDVVSSMVERLSDPDKIFRDSLIQNAKDLCELLPRLNLTGDSNLEAMRQIIVDKLTRSNPDDLRPKENDTPTTKAAKAATRKHTAEEAAKILKDMEAYFPAN
jgi:hypothetical protein